MTLVRSTIYCVVVTVLLFVQNWQLAFFTIGIMLPFLCIGPIYGRFMKAIMKKVSDAKAKAADIAEESFGNIRVVKAFATEDRETCQFLEAINIVYEH